MPVTRQQIPNEHQLSNWEEISSTRSTRQLRDTTVKEMLEAVFSMRSGPSCYKQDKSRIQLAGRQSPVSKDVYTKTEELTALEAVTRQRLVKTQQTGKI
jgi:hypothetical protein